MTEASWEPTSCRTPWNRLSTVFSKAVTSSLRASPSSRMAMQTNAKMFVAVRGGGVVDLHLGLVRRDLLLLAIPAVTHLGAGPPL